MSLRLKNIGLLSALIFAAVLAPVFAAAQSESDNYRIEAGNICWGGGSSASTNAAVSGSVPYQAAGITWAKNRVITGGLFASLYSNGNTFLASYLGFDTDTVTIEDRRMKVIFGGDTGVVTGTMYYRPAGERIYTGVDLMPAVDDTLYYDLAADLITLRGLEFYFELRRGTSFLSLSDAGRPSVFITRVSESEGRCPDTLPDTTYTMVSVPVSIEDNDDATSVFTDDLGPYDPTLWRLGCYDNDGDTVLEYPHIPSVKPGQAYWIISRYARTFGTSGYTVTPNREIAEKDYYEIALDRGWNQVANPFAFPVDWADVNFNYNGIIIGHDSLIVDNIAYFYSNGSYFSASLLYPWRGVFIFVKKTGVKILFPYREAGRWSGRPPTASLSQGDSSSKDWSLKFTLENGGYADGDNYLGVREDATVDADWFDLADPPPPPGKPRLAFRLPEPEKYLRRLDYRPELESGATWDLTFVNTGDCRLIIEGMPEIPPGLDCWLALEGGAVAPIKTDTIIYLDKNIKAAKFIVGNNDYTTDEISPLLPGEFVLYQNYPNPFNPETVISFDLPATAPARLDIFNILGQKVITLLDRPMPAGTNTVIWDGRNETGGRVSTGIYFYRLQSGPFTQSKKMLLLK